MSQSDLYGFIRGSRILRSGLGQGGGDCIEESSTNFYLQYDYSTFRNVATIKFAIDLNSESLPAWELPLVNCYPTVVQLRIKQDRKLRVYVDTYTGSPGPHGANLLGTSDDPVPASGWTVGEMRIKYHNSSGGFIWVRVNEVYLPELDFQNITVFHTSTNQLESVAFGTGSGDFTQMPVGYTGGKTGIRWDNIVLADPTGTGDYDFIGDFRV
jgi:hypothetical protein